VCVRENSGGDTREAVRLKSGLSSESFINLCRGAADREKKELAGVPRRIAECVNARPERQQCACVIKLADNYPCRWKRMRNMASRMQIRRGWLQKRALFDGAVEHNYLTAHCALLFVAANTTDTAIGYSDPRPGAI